MDVKYSNLCRAVGPVMYLLLIVSEISIAQDSTFLNTDSSGIDRQWFFYGSLISLASAFVLLMLFLCVCFCPCSSSLSHGDDEMNINRDAGNEAYGGSVYNLYPGAGETELTKSTYELATIEAHNTSSGMERTKITDGSAFLIGVKKLPEPSDQITSIDDKAMIESEINETIRHLSNSLQQHDVTTGTAETSGDNIDK